MKTSVLLSLAVAIGSAFAQDIYSCVTESSYVTCVSTERDAASPVCASAATLALSSALSLLATCDCSGFEINYSCAKTYSPGDTGLQSQYLDGYSSCTSFVSNPTAVPTVTGSAITSPITQTISSAVPSVSNTGIPASTTTSAVSNKSSSTGTTSAPQVATTSQTSSTTSVSKAGAHPVLTSDGIIGGLLAFVAGMAALI